MKNTITILTAAILLLATDHPMAKAQSQSAPKNAKWKTAAHAALNGTEALAGNYTFSVTTGTYTDLVNATSVNKGELWDDPEYVIPIGFSFKLYDLTLDSLYFGIGVGGLVSSQYDANFEADYLILPFEADLIDRGDQSGISQSPIGYALEGSPGNRILKVEWKNAGFYEELDVNGTLDDHVSFQLWLYEGSNSIEFHMGPNQVTDPDINYYGETGAMVGLSDYDEENAYLLSGTPSNPTLVHSLAFLDGTPPNGTIYRFTKVATGNPMLGSNANVRVYPNPTSGVLNVQSHHGKMQLYSITDIRGNLVQQGQIRSQSEELDLTEFQNGFYVLQLDGQRFKLNKN